jgi:GT2 family glycosyltransferase
MTVTAAIPCYNGASFLGGAIESLLAQTRPAEEILVIDDGSTDGSVEIARNYPVALVQHGNNRGLAAARNTAISRAQCDIIAFLDVDAVAAPDWLEVLLSGYEPHIGGVGGQGIEANIHSLADRWRQAHASQNHGQRPKEVEYLVGLCMSFRREALERVGGFDLAFRTNGEDMDIGMRLTAAGYRLRYVPEARVYHQRTDDEASLKRTMSAWYSAAYSARRVNRQYPWKLFAGTLRRIIVDPVADLVAHRDIEMARLSWQIGWIKLRALWQAARTA